MQTTGNTGTLQGLVSGITATDGHQTGHLNLGELDLTATEGGQRLVIGRSAIGTKVKSET